MKKKKAVVAIDDATASLVHVGSAPSPVHIPGLDVSVDWVDKNLAPRCLFCSLSPSHSVIYVMSIE